MTLYRFPQGLRGSSLCQEDLHCSSHSNIFVLTLPHFFSFTPSYAMDQPCMPTNSTEYRLLLAPGFLAFAFFSFGVVAPLTISHASIVRRFSDSG
jgi:hypothetical protein